MPEVENKKDVNDINSKKIQSVQPARKRVKLGTRNILTAPQKPGFVRRFVNDVKDRVQMFKDAGYSIVEDDIIVGDSKIGRASQLGSGVSSQVGNGVRSVLMEIPEEYYNEDDKEKQDKIKKTENEMRRNLNQSPDGLVGQVSIS